MVEHKPTLWLSFHYQVNAQWSKSPLSSDVPVGQPSLQVSNFMH